MLYLIQSCGFQKVGFSRDKDTLEKRFKGYKTHNPDPNFKVLGVKEGTKEDEKEFHLRLKEYQHYDEWFKLPLEVINELLLEFYEYIPIEKIKKLPEISMFFGDYEIIMKTQSYTMNKTNITSSELLKKFKIID